MSRKTGWQANETGAGINGKVRTKPPSQATAPGPGLLSGPYLAMEGMNIMKTFDELYDEQHETIAQQAEQIRVLNKKYEMLKQVLMHRVGLQNALVEIETIDNAVV